jgi:hypothetical protein
LRHVGVTLLQLLLAASPLAHVIHDKYAPGRCQACLCRLAAAAPSTLLPGGSRKATADAGASAEKRGGHLEEEEEEEEGGEEERPDPALPCPVRRSPSSHGPCPVRSAPLQPPCLSPA